MRECMPPALDDGAPKPQDRSCWSFMRPPKPPSATNDRKRVAAPPSSRPPQLHVSTQCSKCPSVPAEEPGSCKYNAELQSWTCSSCGVSMPPGQGITSQLSSPDKPMLKRSRKLPPPLSIPDNTLSWDPTFQAAPDQASKVLPPAPWATTQSADEDSSKVADNNGDKSNMVTPALLIDDTSPGRGDDQQLLGTSDSMLRSEDRSQSYPGSSDRGAPPSSEPASGTRAVHLYARRRARRVITPVATGALSYGQVGATPTESWLGPVRLRAPQYINWLLESSPSSIVPAANPSPCLLLL